MNSCRPTGAADGGLSIGVGVTLGSGTGVELRIVAVELGTGVVDTATGSVLLVSGDGVTDGIVVEVTIAGADVVGGGEGSPTSTPKHKK